MLFHRFYYNLKPVLPAGFRMMVRRWFARRALKKHHDVWPIKPGTEKPPDGWQGWPGGKQFAVVLTHDVESEVGLARVKQLAELEMKLGFRSSFNLIPEGSYTVPLALRSWLTDNGFEVGVHDLHHDGKLYTSRQAFQEKAVQINRYLKEWGAVGFRSGFMFHNLDWLHDLEIEYDSSTFDTDPFEPQPDGVDTIFPFWVNGSGVKCEARSAKGQEQSAKGQHPFPVLRPLSSGRSGYVELPYTLPQDFTLFVLLREKASVIWRDKLSRIAASGGMALVNVHPDYLQHRCGPPNPGICLVQHYRDFLEYARSRCAADAWLALPHEVAQFVTAHCPPIMRPTRTACS